MTQKDFATKLYIQLKTSHDIEKTVNDLQSATCNSKKISLDKQLEILNQIRQFHVEESKYLFENVDAFLTLVDQVEKQLKKDNSSK